MKKLMTTATLATLLASSAFANDAVQPSSDKVILHCVVIGQDSNSANRFQLLQKYPYFGEEYLW